MTHITLRYVTNRQSAFRAPEIARASPLALGLDRPSFSILRNTNKKVRSRRPSFRAANTKVTQTSAREAHDNVGKAERCTPHAQCYAMISRARDVWSSKDASFAYVEKR